MGSHLDNGAALNLYGAMGRNRTVVTIDFTLAAWNTIGAHKLFTVTGAVRVLIFYMTRTTLTSGGAATIAFGWTTSTGGYAAAQAYTNFSTPGNMIVAGSTAAANIGLWTSFFASTKNADIVLTGVGGAVYNPAFTIAAAAMTGGTMEAVCYWTPITDDGLLVAGTGGTP